MNPLTRFVVFVSLFHCIGLTSFAEKPQTWPQWRGPTRDCKVAGDDWPKSLQGDHLQQLWRVELGPGYPGPIVTKDRVFVAETKDKKFEVVRALDRTTGTELWKTMWNGAMSVPFFARSNGSWIRSTPAYDGDSLYVAGMRDVLVCLDATYGKERWRVNFVERFKTPLPSFGFVCSPLVDENAVYVQAGASLVKLDKHTGKTIWRTLEDGGGMYGSAFSSPYLTKLQGGPQLLVQSRTKLAGVDPVDGKTLWSQKVEAFRGMNILTPTVHNDHVFTSSYGGKSHLFGLVKADDSWKAKEIWNNKAEAYMSSPVLLDGHVYVHLRNQRFGCFDLKTGEEKWTSVKRFGKYWSMAVQNNRILALDEQGVLYLIQANTEKFELLDSRKISESPTWGHIAVVGDEIYVRELGAIVAYRWR